MRSTIKPHRLHLGMGARIIAGFFGVLILMASLTVVGLRYVAEANQRLREITQNNNVKTELATTMQSALRERALSMHVLSILTDPFERDDEIQRFNAFGAVYLEARRRFELLPLTPEEHALIVKIRDQTKSTQPQVQRVVAMSSSGVEQSKVFDQIRNVALPMQREIAEQLGALLELQREQTASALRYGEASYAHVRDLMLVLCAAAVLVGIAIASFVSRRVTQQAEQLATQAMYDPLTGLPNRSLFHHQLERQIARARREPTVFGVMLMDLDRFKEVNDTLGHEVGDELLKEVGRRLQETLRPEDLAARLGGDEYVLLLQDIEASNVAAIAKRLLAAFDKPFHWQNQSIDIAASLGVSLFPSQCSDPSGLIRCADIAMYVAKRSGNGYALYASDQERVSRSDLSLKSELRVAIQAEQLSLYYQPQIDHRTQRVTGVEALVRWNHPQRGFLTPDIFISVAEEAGLMGALTQWVLKTALCQIGTLHAAGTALTVAVNLSARSLHDEKLPATIAALLSETGVAAAQLTLEITESAVMSNPGEALTILTELDRMGVTLAIDDFGTGYSSLAYLKRLPVDDLKVDKSFVLDMENNESDAVIVRSTIDLAHNLGMTVTAEGVESQGTWNALSVLGCDRSQGYFMGRPMPVEKLETWLRQSMWAVDLSEQS